jgi:hypothetical protein
MAGLTARFDRGRPLFLLQRSAAECRQTRRHRHHGHDHDPSRRPQAYPHDQRHRPRIRPRDHLHGADLYDRPPVSHRQKSRYRQRARTRHPHHCRHRHSDATRQLGPVLRDACGGESNPINRTSSPQSRSSLWSRCRSGHGGRLATIHTARQLDRAALSGRKRRWRRGPSGRLALARRTPGAAPGSLGRNPQRQPTSDSRPRTRHHVVYRDIVGRR